MALTYEVINNPDIVEEYIDDYLYDRLKHDGTKGIQDFIAGGHHLGFYNNGNLVGIITIAFKDGYVMAHPKFRKRHMIYAGRCCLTALVYLQGIDVKTVILLIPDIFKANVRMALACGFKKMKESQDSTYINNAKVGVTAYGIEIVKGD